MAEREITRSRYYSALAYMWNLREKRANSYHLSQLSGSSIKMLTYSRSALATSWITSNSSARRLCLEVKSSVKDY